MNVHGQPFGTRTRDPTLYPAAVVVGMCAHGLALARALHRAQIAVIGIEANRNVPGVATNAADVRIVPDISGDDLITSLLELGSSLGGKKRPVLFLTNDRMVEVVASRVEEIAARFHLSWARSSRDLTPMLKKDEIEFRCQQSGLRYPKTVLLDHLHEPIEQLATIRFPVIIKPTRPLSSFKTIVAECVENFLAVRHRITHALPVIVQELIPGDDSAIRFGALYLKDGEVLARFEGRKMRSRPMGHTTIAISERNEHVHELAMRFFSGLCLSGPVSLEIKTGPDGTDWVIEPTVGRTDFWVDLCNANGVCIPQVEYFSQVLDDTPPTVQQDNVIWINGERDPGALLWLIVHNPTSLLKRSIRGVYFNAKDLRPFVASVKRLARRLPRRMWRKIIHLVSSSKIRANQISRSD